MSEFVRAHYDAAPEREWERLGIGLSRVEFAATLRLVEKYFPQAGAVCDIGGGPGRYAIELHERGYEMTLLDLSEKLLRRAKQAFVAAGASGIRVLHGDARDLGVFADESFDDALFLGPQYHLIGREDRSQALSELVRILKPGGRAIVAFLNSWGLMRTGVVDFPERFRDAAFLRDMLDEKTFAGRELSGFTECHWSNPEIARKELGDAGLRIVSYAGVESFLSGMGPLLEPLRRDEPAVYGNLVNVAAQTAELPQFRDATDHLHFVVER